MIRDSDLAGGSGAARRLRARCLLIGLMLGALLVPSSARAQDGVVLLGDLSAFEPAGSNWSVAGAVVGTWDGPLTARPGTGVLVNTPRPGAMANLYTRLEHEDVYFSVEVMMPAGSNSGIYFQSRYEIQLLDSWGTSHPQHSDIGGVYQRWDPTRGEGREGYEGVPPRLNAALAPGLWQRLDVVFRAARVAADGTLLRAPRFERVVLNGVVLHEDVFLSGPTRGGDASPLVGPAPLMIQGDHGPVAFRNLVVRPLQDTDSQDDADRWVDAEREGRVAQRVPREDRPMVFRAMIWEEDRPFSHAAYLGFPEGVAVGLDLHTGALLRWWRGAFLDVHPMWSDRAYDQRALELGALRKMPAVLPFVPGPPETVALQRARPSDRPEGYRGYTISPGAIEIDHPSFSQRWEVARRGPAAVLTRTVRAAEAGWVVIAHAEAIRTIAPGSFNIDGQYYVEVEQSAEIVAGADGAATLRVYLTAGAVATSTYIW